MPTIGGNTFRINTDFVDRLTKKIGSRVSADDKVIGKRITLATNMIWRIAHQKRPMMSKIQMKAQGRTKRVSDPGAQAGVPVDTGALQGSIQQSVTHKKLMGWEGKIWTKGIHYARFIEYGTSKMWARPFMRPAIWLTEEAIKRMLGTKVDSNL